MTEEERRRMASSAVPKFPEGQTASVRNWSQNPAVAAAMKTGNVAEIEKATTAARDAFRAGGTWADRAMQVPLNPTPALQQRTPEQQQDLLAQMRETGAGIRSRLDQESVQRGYAFRQGLADTAAQRGGMAGAQAAVESERWKQAQTGRNPMSRAPLDAFGFQFQRGSMGQYSPLRSIGTSSGFAYSGGPQPLGGFMSSGFMPSFASSSIRAGESKDDWLRRNYPQDYSVGPFGGESVNMVYRSNPFDQTGYL
jgi:hypothetical protein